MKKLVLLGLLPSFALAATTRTTTAQPAELQKAIIIFAIIGFIIWVLAKKDKQQ